MKSESFGEFLHSKRLEQGLSYRELAVKLKLTAPYLSDIEKGRRNAPALELLEKLAQIFHLSVEEKEEMLNLAGENRDEVAPDIPMYIKGNEPVMSALRTARDMGATNEDWQKFVDELKNRKKNV